MLDSLTSQFHNYQLLFDENIRQNVWKVAKTNLGGIQIDRIWYVLNEIKHGCGSYGFKKLSKISRLIMTTPHLNHEKERILSMAREKETCFHPNLNRD